MGYLTDASYKQAQAEVYGQLTTSAVATGSQLVAFSGFSNSNYVREAYSADLDFGTGEWTASAWVNSVDSAPANTLTYSAPTSTQPTVWTLTGCTEGQPNSYLGTNTAVLLGSTGATVLRNGAGGQFPYKSYLSFLVNGTTETLTFGSSDASVGGQSITLNLSTSQFSYFSNKLFSNGVVTPLTGNWKLVTLYSSNTTSGLRTFSVSSSATTTLVDAFQVQYSAVRLVYYPTTSGTVTTTVSPIVDRSHSSGPSIKLGFDYVGKLTATASDGITTRTVTTDAAYNTGTWLKVRANYQAGKLAILVNGVEVKSTIGAPLLSLNSRYNLLTNTEQFDVWSRNQITSVNADAVSGPYPNTYGDAVIANSTSINHYLQRASAITLSVGASATCSIFVKAGNKSFYHCIFYESGSNYASIGVSIADGTSTVNAAVGGSSISATVTSIGSGWVRIAVTFTAGIPGTFNLDQGPGESKTLMTFSGDGVTPNIYFWGAQLETGSTAKTYQRVGSVVTDFDFKAPLTIGNNYAATAPFPGSIALLKFSATVPSTEQSIWMYEQEKQMFREGAQVALPDANAIQDLAYDDLTDRWIAVSTTNKSTWSGLVRTASEAVSAGSYTKVSAASGIQLAARSTTNPGVDITIPAYNVKARAKKKAEKSKKLTNATAIYDFTPVVFSNATLTNGSNVMTVTTANTTGTPYIGMGITGTGIAAGTTIVGTVSGTLNSYYLSAAYTGTTGSTYTVGQSTFPLPVGYTAKLVYSGGLIQREGSTKAFTRTFDGFRETIVFGTSPGTSVVQIHATKQ